MNILLFIKNLQGRGVSKVYLNLAKLLQSGGYNVFFVIRQNIVEFDTSFLNNFFVISDNITNSLDNLIQEKRVDFIISNNVEYCQNLKAISQDKIFYSVHMLWGERLYKQLRFKKIWQLQKEYKDKNIIAISNAVKDDLLNKIKIKPKRVDVIYDYFDFDEIEKKSNEYSIDMDNYIINIGAFSSEKNHKLLIETYRKLNTNCDLVLIGDGKLRVKIERLVKKYNLENRVHFLGFLKNPYPYLKNAKLTLLSSKNEALPGVAIESLFLNTPVISTNSKGIQEVLINELSNFIAKDNKHLVQLAKRALISYPKIDSSYYNKFSKELLTSYNKLFKKDSSV